MSGRGQWAQIKVVYALLRGCGRQNHTPSKSETKSNTGKQAGGVPRTQMAGSRRIGGCLQFFFPLVCVFSGTFSFFDASGSGLIVCATCVSLPFAFFGVPFFFFSATLIEFTRCTSHTHYFHLTSFRAGRLVLNPFSTLSSSPLQDNAASAVRNGNEEEQSSAAHFFVVGGGGTAHDGLASVWSPDVRTHWTLRHTVDTFVDGGSLHSLKNLHTHTHKQWTLFLHTWIFFFLCVTLRVNARRRGDTWC